MDQPARMASLDAFKTGAVDLIVCSDVAARGLDIPDVSHVFNFDLPTHAEDYVHRIGRTGRAGKSGTALSLVTSDDVKYLADIEKLIGNPIEWIGGGLDSVVDEGGREERGGGGRGRPGRGRAPHGGDRTRESAARAEKFATRAPRPPREEGEESRAPRQPREERQPREARPPREERQPRDVRPAREEFAPRTVRPASVETVRPPRDSGHLAGPREERRPRYNDHDDGPPVLGLGDHVPSFLLRPTKFVKRDEVAVEE